MTDYIKREDALNTIRNTFTGMTADTLELRINDIPSADVAPIVRCKDCRWKADTIGESWCDFHFYEFTILSDDDFCSNGERKDNEDR